jgi:hypothetical protein
MENEKNILNQFENLAPIEPSNAWSKMVIQKMDNSRKRSEGNLWTVFLFSTIVILLSINLFSFTKSLKQEKKQENYSKYQNVANEFLVTSNSSKY